jgi:hypothetical protein
MYATNSGGWNLNNRFLHSWQFLKKTVRRRDGPAGRLYKFAVSNNLEFGSGRMAYS